MFGFDNLGKHISDGIYSTIRIPYTYFAAIVVIINEHFLPSKIGNFIVDNFIKLKK